MEKRLYVITFTVITTLCIFSIWAYNFFHGSSMANIASGLNGISDSISKIEMSDKIMEASDTWEKISNVFNENTTEITVQQDSED